MDSWLNTIFLEGLIRRNSPEGTGVTVIDFHVKPAVSSGNNYLGNLLRITVDYCSDNAEKKTLHLIAKAVPTSETLQNFISEVRAFDKEDCFYRETAHRLQEARDLVPRSYQSSTRAIILEDLAQHGFKMRDRLEGLDLDHLRLVVRAMARFHASSAALYHQDPNSMNAYGESMFPEEDRHGYLSKYFHNQLRTLAEGLQQWPGYEKYAGKLYGLLPSAMKRMSQAVKPNPGSFCVLNHSDLWVSNLLFHYDPVTRQVDNVKFIDFQALRFASPVLDLQLFLYSSANDDARVKSIQNMLEEYHDQLIITLRKLGLDPGIYTMKQLKQDFEDKKDFGFLMVCMDLSSMLTESGAEEDGENVFSFKKTIASKRFREVFSSLIPHFESQGLL